MNNETARIEVWHRELRELRRNQIGLVPKLEDKGKPPTSGRGEPWPKKSYAAVEVTTPGTYATSSFSDATSSQAKRISRVGSSSSPAHLLPQEHFTLSVPNRNGPRVWNEDAAEEALEESRLPLLARPARHADRNGGTSEAPRLRFTATMQPGNGTRPGPSK